MAKKHSLPRISHPEFFQLLEALDTPVWTEPGSSIAAADVARTSYVLQYLTEPYWWPVDQKHDDILLRAIERAEWGLYDGNFIHLAASMYGYTEQSSNRREPFASTILNSTFAKVSAIGYALVSDVHPERKPNLRSRIEFWGQVTIDEKEPSYLKALIQEWLPDLSEDKYSHYGSMLQMIDPMASRSSSTMHQILEQLYNPTNYEDSVSFSFDSSQ